MTHPDGSSKIGPKPPGVPAFRHRSAFAPFWVAPAAFIAAARPTGTMRDGGYP